MKATSVPSDDGDETISETLAEMQERLAAIGSDGRFYVREGRSLKGGNEAAQAIGEHCVKMARSRGVCTAEMLAEEAESGSTLLRPHFTWDTKEGMHKLHVIEARTMLRTICFVSHVGSKKREISAFYSVPVVMTGNRASQRPEQRERSYMVLPDVLEDPERLALAMQDIVNQITGLERRLGNLDESSKTLARARKSIQRRIESLRSKRRRKKK